MLDSHHEWKFVRPSYFPVDNPANEPLATIVINLCLDWILFLILVLILFILTLFTIFNDVTRGNDGRLAVRPGATDSENLIEDFDERDDVPNSNKI